MEMKETTITIESPASEVLSGALLMLGVWSFLEHVVYE